MSMRRAATLGAAVVASAGIAASITNAGELWKGKKKTPVVKVKDDVFTPAKVTIKKDNKVKYKWDKNNGNKHNVQLSNGPRRVKKKDFESDADRFGVKFAPKFKKPGTYKFYCAFHPTQMEMTVKVKK